MSKISKHALVLSGGGFRGAFQVGALNHLATQWSRVTGQPEAMKFDIIAGVSVGALNGAMMAMNNLSGLNGFWDEVIAKGAEEIYTSHVLDTSVRDRIAFKPDLAYFKDILLPNFKSILPWWKFILLLFPKQRKKILDALADDLKNNISKVKSLTDNSPLRRKLENIIDPEKISKDCTFICGFTSLDDTKYYGVKSTDFESFDDLISGIIASTIMPIIWAPVPEVKFRLPDGSLKIARNNVDGGIRTVSPLGDVLAEIYKRNEPDTEWTIWILNCNSFDAKVKDCDEYNIAQIALRSLPDIAVQEVLTDDIGQFMRVNDLVNQANEANISKPLLNYDFRTETRTRPLKTFKSILITPDIDQVSDTLLSSAEVLNARKAHGEEKIKAALDKYFPVVNT